METLSFSDKSADNFAWLAEKFDKLMKAFWYLCHYTGVASFLIAMHARIVEMQSDAIQAFS